MPLKAGDIAPDFSAKDQKGKTVKLSSFRGKKVLLYFYPTDDTPACTAQACNLQLNKRKLALRGYQIIGISTDDEKSHKKFAEKYGLTFPILPDTERTVHDSYDVWGHKKLFGHEYMGTLRTTFLINEEGIITRVIEKVKTADHAAQVMDV
ncbi:MAG: thioredoxin-dependent thiol peroxidase [Bacteroidota bacterium]